VITIGVLIPHATPGSQVELPAISAGFVSTRVARVVDGEPSTAAANLRTLTRPAVLDRAADTLLNYSIDAVAYASTTSAYVIGFDAETAMATRLASRVAVPVVAPCRSSSPYASSQSSGSRSLVRPGSSPS
jgi:maleate isomerase